MAMNAEEIRKNYFRAEVFAERLRSERKKRGISQKKLAEAIGRASGSYISNIETCRNIPSIDSAVDIANALGVSLNYLCDQKVTDEIPFTLGDIARALIVLSFLDGVEIETELQDRISYMTSGDKVEKYTEKKWVHILQLYRGNLRTFLTDYQTRIQDRGNPRKFIKWLNKSLAELDNVPAWETKNVAKWDERTRAMLRKGLPEEQFKELIWNKVSE